MHDAVRLRSGTWDIPSKTAHNRERSICCGSGGMVPAVAPELAKKMTDFRLSEATRDLVTYCASCRARLAKAGAPYPARPESAVQPGLAANQNPAAAPLPDPLVAALAAETVFREAELWGMGPKSPNPHP